MKSAEFNNIEQEKIELTAKLNSFLNDWSNEIPQEILHSKGQFKVRINWWTMVCGNLYIALDFIMDPQVKIDCINFLNKYAGTDYWNNCTNRTSKEDIEVAKKGLGDVIKNLKNIT